MKAAGAVQGAIDFALMLEIFEREFYRSILGTSDMAAQNSAFAALRAGVPARTLQSLHQIQKHESAHVAFLNTIGAVNVLDLSASSFDFTAGRGAGNGPFAAVTTDLAALLLMAQAVEDLGVRAYKGQITNVMSDPVILESVFRLHSVEARHASKIRRLRRQAGAPPVVRSSGTVSGDGATAAGSDPAQTALAAAVAALGLVYAGEGNTTQIGVDLTTLSGLPTSNIGGVASEAFDEPLDRARVIGVLQPFFIPTIPA